MFADEPGVYVFHQLLLRFFKQTYSVIGIGICCLVSWGGYPIVLISNLILTSYMKETAMIAWRK